MGTHSRQPDELIVNEKKYDITKVNAGNECSVFIWMYCMTALANLLLACSVRIRSRMFVTDARCHRTLLQIFTVGYAFYSLFDARSTDFRRSVASIFVC